MKNLSVILVMALLVACTRSEEGGSTKIQIIAPDRKVLAGKLDITSLAFPNGIKVCYGVGVTASDIPGRASSCSGSVGSRAGFVGEGGALSVEVSRGDARTVTLYAFLTEPASSCPSWDEAFHENGSNYQKVFKVGSASGISTQKDVTVEIQASFDSQQASVAAQTGSSSCGGGSAGSLRAMVYYDGTVINPATPETPAFQRPFIDSIIQMILGVFSESAFALVNTSGTTVGAGTEVQFPFLHSFAKKPDSGVIYALTEDNQIVQITGNTTFEHPAQCPFDVPACKLPEWVQSMSPGNGTDMFSLDHGGTIYKSTTTELVATGTTVLPIVRQVTYY